MSPNYKTIKNKHA